MSNGIADALEEFAKLVRSPVRRATPKQNGRQGRRMKVAGKQCIGIACRKHMQTKVKEIVRSRKQ